MIFYRNIFCISCFHILSHTDIIRTRSGGTVDAMVLIVDDAVAVWSL